MKICITGVTLTGNMGGVAMLETTIQQLTKRFPQAKFELLSITPKKDRAAKAPKQLTIIDCNFLKLILFITPLLIILKPFLHFRWLYSFLPFEAIHSLIDADFVIDLSGIAFVDNRGIPLLVYNICVCLPAILLKRPIYKLAQALGPFNKRLNRFFAKLILSHCKSVIARGQTTYQYLKNLGLNNVSLLSDVTFALAVEKNHYHEAKAILHTQLTPSEINNFVIISPSAVVHRYLKSISVDLPRLFARIADYLKQRGIAVVLLPHSLDESKNKNNDIIICHEIKKINPELPMIILKNPATLRAIISNAQFFIGCRFHAVVSAVSMCVPPIVIGWNHKYSEVLADFDLQSWVIDYAELSEEKLLKKISDLLSCAQEIRSAMTQPLSIIRNKARSNYQLLTNEINESIRIK